MKSVRTKLEGVTLEDLLAWAGDKIYHRAKEYVSCVSQLSCTEDGTLVAWVSGSDEYATWVRCEGEGDFDFACTCPYDRGACKHAVALLLAAAEALKQHKELPLLDPEDDLYLDAFEEGGEDWDDDAEMVAQVISPVQAHKKELSETKKLLADKSRDELQEMLIDLAAEFPAVTRSVREKGQLESGKVDQLVRSLRKEIRKLTAQEAWYDPWKRRGNLPDYSHLQKQLQLLLNNGNADAIFDLGEELWTRGIEQVEQSNDEGMTAGAISACLEIVLLALPQTALSPVEQLLWLVERELEDQYGLLGDTDSILNNRRYVPEHWQKVSAVIEKKLKLMAVPQTGHFSDRYQRERVVLWLRDTYLRSKELSKIIPLLEQEAARCLSYETLVNALLDAGETERARQWCILGFEQTLADAPGIASGLQRQLRKLAESEGEFKLVAAYRAEDFFESPSIEAYIDLRKAAEKADVWLAVRSAVLDFLQNGKRPAGGSKGETVWSLPEPEVKSPESKGAFRPAGFPNREMLIEIAILEQRFADAVSIYSELDRKRRWNYSVDELLAKSVATSHPETALQIWQSIAEGLIGQVKPKAYQEAAKYLRKMHRVYEQTERLVDWQALIQHYRTRHKAKRRLMEVLDDLETKRKLID